MTRIRIDLGAGYDAVVGPLEAALAGIGPVRGTIPLVSDADVFALHGARVAALLPVEPVLVPAGEAAKGWDGLTTLVEAFHRLNLARDQPVIALGGGSVGDLAGLAAALFKRGCPVIQIPTTLLAQADSAIGGKTAIDACGVKNLVGAFHQPALVIADPSLLATLDDRQMRAGYAEVVKYGLIDDAGFFQWCEANGPALLARDPAALAHAVEHCIRAKARIAAGDVDDRSGQRALLNLGHSFGHAIEEVAGLGGVLHGEAVAVGMIIAMKFSASLGLTSSAEVERVARHFAAAGLPISLVEAGIGGRGAELVPAMIGDKKNESDGLTLILSRGVGRAFIERGVDPASVADFLAAIG